MKKIKSFILFIIIFLIIVILDFYLYKNIDKLIPKNDGYLYIFENNVKEKNTEFLEEIFKYVEVTNYKRASKEEINRIIKNKTLYSLLKNYIYEISIFEKEMNEGKINVEEFKEILMEELYTGKLINTIYGDLNVIMIISNNDNYYYSRNNSDYLIVYSNDMSKFYYLNVSKKIICENMVENGIDDNDKMIYYDENGEEKQLSTGISETNREEILNKVNKVFSKVFINKEFKPDTIIYRENYYILKDTTEDITLYYDKQEDTIFGLYIGFYTE